MYTSRVPQADRRGAVVGASAVRKNVSWKPKRRPRRVARRAEIPGPVPPLRAERRVRAVVRRERERPRREGAREARGAAGRERLGHGQGRAEPPPGRGVAVQPEGQRQPGAAAAPRSRGRRSRTARARACAPHACHSLPQRRRGRRPRHAPGRVRPRRQGRQDGQPQAWSRTSRGHRGLDRPAERAAVDHVDQDQRQPDADGDGEQAREHAEEPRLGQHEPPDLARREALRAQDAELPGALELERHQRAQHADEGHRRRQDAQHGGDRERAVEDLERGLPERAVRADQEVLARARPRAQRRHRRLGSTPGASTSPSEETPRSSQFAS